MNAKLTCKVASCADLYFSHISLLKTAIAIFGRINFLESIIPDLVTDVQSLYWQFAFSLTLKNLSGYLTSVSDIVAKSEKCSTISFLGPEWHWDIWSEWWGGITWPKKNNDKFIWRSPSKITPRNFVTLETFDQSDEGTWPDRPKEIDKTQIQRPWQRQIHCDLY